MSDRRARDLRRRAAPFHEPGLFRAVQPLRRERHAHQAQHDLREQEDADESEDVFLAARLADARIEHRTYAGNPCVSTLCQSPYANLAGFRGKVATRTLNTRRSWLIDIGNERSMSH